MNLLLFIKKIYYFIIKISKIFFTRFFLIINNVFIFITKAFNLFWSIIWYTILSLSIIMLVLVPIFYNWIILWNIDYLSIVPKEIIISYLFLVLSIAIFGIYFILKKRFLIHFIFFWISTVFIFSFWFIWWTKIYNSYSYEWKIVKNYSIGKKNNYIYSRK